MDAAVDAVDAVRAAAERYHERTGTWPADPGGHALPPELASALTAAPDAGPPRTALDWSVWEILEEPEAPESLEPPTTPARLPARDTVVHPPPEVGKLAGIAVRSGDPRILAELLLRYASERSFVRDSTWTLVLGGVHRRR